MESSHLLPAGARAAPAPQAQAPGRRAAPARARAPAAQVEVNVLEGAVHGVDTPRYMALLAIITNVPQIVAGVFILHRFWGDASACDADHRLRWRLWSVVQLVIIAAHTVVRIAIARAAAADASSRRRRGRRHHRDPVPPPGLATTKSALEAVGLLWFCLGNLWLFGSADDACGAAAGAPSAASPIYQLCLALMVILYVQICLPCVLAVLLVPVLCMCLPCVVRALAYLHDPMAGRGAASAVIDALPVVKWGERGSGGGGGGSSRDVTTDVESGGGAAARPGGWAPASGSDSGGGGGGTGGGGASGGASGGSGGGSGGYDSLPGVEAEVSCPICLVDYEIGDELRALPCGHALHRGCVDPWLHISATCPCCRTSILRRRRAASAATDDDSDDGGSVDGGSDDDGGGSADGDRGGGGWLPMGAGLMLGGGGMGEGVPLSALDAV